MDEIVGTIERITFKSEESGYVVLQLKEAGKKDLTPVVGTLPHVRPGETIRVEGEWKNHLIHGRQFEAKGHKSERPADLHGIEKYLGSGLIKGIGPGFAKKIVARFGIATLDILDKNPERLSEIPGLGEKKLNNIADCWQMQKSIREVMIFLQSHGVSPGFAQKIYKRFGDKSIEKVTENPYRLAREVTGIGFKSADDIAKKLGMAPDAPERIDAALEFVLEELSGEGHTCYPEAAFKEQAAALLGDFPLQERIEALLEERRLERINLVQEGTPTPFVWLSPLFRAETGIASELKRILISKSPLRSVDTYKAIDWVEAKLNLQLASQQKGAVAAALCEKLLIITGGPGTGKSTITKAILAITEQLTTRLLLAAPTGRAAKRMSEICKRPAKTIHALLEYNYQNGFKRGRENPLEADLIIIDEASMIDTQLMQKLLRAIPDNCRLIFVGDVDQLPSVGPGNVLKDMIASRMIPTATLTEIFRQGAGSRIVVNAHRINKGSMPDTKAQKDSDFFFIEEEDPEKVLAQVLALNASRLPMRYGLHPLNDIQVLVPMKKGIIGADNLNLALQEKLNGKESYIERMGRRFAEGDKVMQIKNNYQKEIYNGDIGLIKTIDRTDETLIVAFDDKEIFYEFSELDELTLAYAVSVHKYQGSESKAIILIVHTSHFKLLQRNLLYTGVTRGKQLVILIGNYKGLMLAVKNEEVLKRFSGLEHFISASL
jgi:exodeoxyribonuclease V alpha subunit